jgi:5-methylcytosine-specific restriction endonuclease McrA
MISQRKVLTLNASYEPLGAVAMPRALRMVWQRAAETLEYDADRVLRTVRFTFQCPSVIRLLEYVNVRKRRGAAGGLRSKIFIRDRYRCQYCGVKGTLQDLTLDHILPRSRGGQSVPENLCACCHPCNQRKGDRTPDEARMPLLSNPSALWYDLDLNALHHAAAARPEWRKYLYLSDEAETAA